MDTMSTKAMKRMVRHQVMRAGSTVLKVKRLGMIVRQSRKRKRLKSRNQRAKKDSKIPLRPQMTMQVTICMRRKAGAMVTGSFKTTILLNRSLAM